MVIVQVDVGLRMGVGLRPLVRVEGLLRIVVEVVHRNSGRPGVVVHAHGLRAARRDSSVLVKDGACSRLRRVKVVGCSQRLRRVSKFKSSEYFLHLSTPLTYTRPSLPGGTTQATVDHADHTVQTLSSPTLLTAANDSSKYGPFVQEIKRFLCYFQVG